MPATNSLLRLVWPTALTSLLLLGLCTSVAVCLYRQQAHSADVLGENIGSRRAAADLEESVADLIALDRSRTEHLAPLHRRIEAHLADIHRFADKDEERRWAELLTASFRRYRRRWESREALAGAAREAAAREALAILERQTLPFCRALRDYNARQIDESEQDHRRTLRWLAWGLAGVGGIGSLGGLLLGYAVARGLRRSIHRLSVHIQDAAGKLGRDLPTVVLAEGGDLDYLHRQMGGLVAQIEHVVQTLQQREHEVLRSEQLAAVGQLAAGVAHEIRNPLTSIKMLVQASREEAEAHGLPAEDLEVIDLEIRRLERTLNTFLDFARPPRPRRARLDLAPLAERTLKLIQGRALKQQVALRLSPPPDPAPVEADGEQLQQVLVNLALNALDAMPHGGTLEVSLRHDGDAVEVRVSDSGPGIAPELMPRLFEPFTSGKETGLGLGLVVSRRIVEEHGGTLEAWNLPGGGACFLCRLPAAPEGGGVVGWCERPTTGAAGTPPVPPAHQLTTSPPGA